MTMKDGHMEIKTSAGTIVVYENADPGAPGCSVLLRPDNGDGVVIDLCCVEVHENADYRNRGEDKKDVVVYSYASCYTEEPTDIYVIKHGDVIKALEIEEGDE